MEYYAPMLRHVATLCLLPLLVHATSPPLTPQVVSTQEARASSSDVAAATVLLLASAIPHQRQRASSPRRLISSLRQRVRKGVRDGVDVDVLQHDGKSLLHLAAKLGDRELVQEVLKRTQDVNTLDAAGRTLLHYAAQEGHLKLVQELLAKGDVMLRGDREGTTPLDLAARRGHDEVIRAIMAVDPSQITSRDNSRRSALYYAAVGGHYTTCELLMSLGTSAEGVDKYGRSVLHYVAMHGHSHLLPLFADLPSRCMDFCHQMPIDCARMRGHLDLAQELAAWHDAPAGQGVIR